MDQQPNQSTNAEPDSNNGQALAEVKEMPHKGGVRLLWMYNLSANFTTAIFHALLTRVVPKHYPHYHCQFLLAIAFAAFNVLVTIRIKKGLLGVQSFFSMLHLLWVFYCFSTVPVFLTAISTNHEECNPQINSCVRESIEMSVFNVKMMIGLSAQLFFVIILYGEMKRLCLLLAFPFVVESTKTIQPTGFDNNSAEFDCPTGNELPEKNPNDIIIAA
ncbi:CBN-XBX-3 protein [Caenorhabditis brenneri]|uniref:CBN-XBX-3 protein n=1 Tax=Caenorhabditis brenneri TaxID=135651 RepID=G0MKG4_CAEBE|nr:CBN-XBX-3 protein [Caenorhabditis brenneri]